MSSSTGATVLQAADNIFSQLKVVNETLLSHAHAYMAYRTQQKNMEVLAARMSGSSSSSIRERTAQRVNAQVDDAIRSMHEDLKQMQNLIDQASLLPRQHVKSEESERINVYVQAHRQDLMRKQALVNIGLSQISEETQGMTSEQWMAAMKEPLQYKDAEREEMDDLANALGNW